MKMKSLLVLLFLTLASTAANGQVAIELILDASGSMNAPLTAKETRLEGANKAIAAFLPTVPANATLAFRAYGHQSPRAKHDCNDTALVVPFSNVATAKTAVLQMLPALKAQGYTPITKVIELAAKDLGSTPGRERMIILVSDGRETCDGDPCAMARALKQANVSLVIHTVGLGVDNAARSELQCISSATGGTYFDAIDAGQLSNALQQAVKTAAHIPEPKKDGRGKLKVNNASHHRVLDAATGKEVTSIDKVNTEVPLPSGFYNVTFGDQVWRGVEVVREKTTVLEPAVIKVSPLRGQVKILDPETGAERGSLNDMHTTATLLPGTYALQFGEMEVPFVRVEAGKPFEMKTGMIVVNLTGLGSAQLRDGSGRRVASLDTMNRRATVPAGSYILVSGGKSKTVAVKSGEEIEVEP